MTGRAAERVLGACLDRPPTLGSGRLLCVDGRAGSGKTTFARALRRTAAHRVDTRVLHMDDMYEGWAGLAGVSARVARDLVVPLRHGRTGRYHRFDWARGCFGDWVWVPPVDLLVLEGVGSGSRDYHQDITTLVWVEAPRSLRLDRGLVRDGIEVREHWLAWMAQEDALFEVERTRHRAHILVDGTDVTAVPGCSGQG